MDVLWTLSVEGKVVAKSYDLSEVDSWFLRLIEHGYEPPVIGVEGVSWGHV